MENMEYYTRRLQCSDEEKDACLETVAKLYQLRIQIRDNGFLMAEVLAETEPDPFFRVCLLELSELWWDPDGLERLLNRYLLAGDYWGGAFLNAALIVRGIVLLSRRSKDGFNADADYSLRKDWEDALGEAVRGYFGIEYRQKVMDVIKQVVHTGRTQQEYPSLMPEFDDLTKLSPAQRDWLVRQFPDRTLRLALKVGGSAVREFLMGGMENREEFERDLKATCNVRAKDVEAAQKEVLKKAKEIPECM